MLLCHHSAAASNAVRKVSPGGQLFVTCVVVLMLLSVFSETWEIATLEAEFLASDITLEFLGSLGLRHWNLLELILAGGAVSLVLSAVVTSGVLVPKAMRSTGRRRPDKIPI
jgi:ABC-type Fe3+-siderophore transport system permease subunit